MNPDTKATVIEFGVVCKTLGADETPLPMPGVFSPGCFVASRLQWAGMAQGKGTERGGTGRPWGQARCSQLHLDECCINLLVIVFSVEQSQC